LGTDQIEVGKALSGAPIMLLAVAKDPDKVKSVAWLIPSGRMFKLEPQCRLPAHEKMSETVGNDAEIGWT